MNNGMTISEKILSRKSGQQVTAGDIVIADLDGMKFHDGTFTLVKEAWDELEFNQILNSDRIIAIIDHSAPAPSAETANIHRQMKEFTARHQIQLYDVGEGIGHQLMPEQGHVGPGQLVVGADSHTVLTGRSMLFLPGSELRTWPRHCRLVNCGSKFRKQFGSMSGDGFQQG